MAPEKPEPKANKGPSSRAGELLLLFAKAFIGSFFRLVVFVSYMAFSMKAFVAAPPEGIFLFAAPLSLIGLWLLLYHFDLVRQALWRHWIS